MLLVQCKNLKFIQIIVHLSVMDNRYFRKLQPRRLLASWFKKLLRNKQVRILLLIGTPALLFMTFSNKGILQRVNLEAQKQALEIQIREAQIERTRLELESEALDHDLKAIERVAREKYLMVKPGEMIYKVRKEQ